MEMRIYFMKLFIKIIKSTFTVVLAVSLITLRTVAAEQVNKLNFVALGNCLTAGQMSDGTYSKGYADLLADEMKKENHLKSFTRRYTVSNYTSEDVLRDILNDVKKEVEGNLDELGIQETIRQAHIVTLDVGANDVLQEMKSYSEFDFDTFLRVMTKFKHNLSAILTEIKKLNPEAHVYVMGYYNAFPHLPQDRQPTLLRSLELMNKSIEEIAKQSKSIYIPTAKAIAQDAKTYLPNPQNPYLSVTGHQAIANAFWKEMQSLFTVKDVDETTQTTNFTDITYHWAEDDIKDAGKKGVVCGYPDGKFKPEHAITRAEFVVILRNSLRLKEKDTVVKFADDKQIGAWAKLAVNQAVQMGIANRDEGGNFRPNEQLTYAKALTMITKAGKLLFNDAIIIGSINDKAISQWIRDSMERIYERSIMGDRKGNKFAPNDKFTRAQTVVMVLQMLEYKKQRIFNAISEK